MIFSMAVILIFLDGIGIGDNNLDYNPCLCSQLNLFLSNTSLPFNGKKYSLDATLNVNGLPQSATGQTTIYTGINAARLIGKHLFGFPNEELKRILEQNSLFVRLESRGYKCQFINAFRPIFFTSPELFKNMRMSATTEMNRSAGLEFNSIKDIKNKKALYHDFTNSEIISKGFQIPEFDATIAAEILVNQSKEYDLILYEYFLTDKAGHSRNMKYAISEINKVEKLIYNVAEKIFKTKDDLVVCSDHGNIENLRSKSHTLNPAFFGTWTTKEFGSLNSILDIYSLIINLLESQGTQE